MKKSTLRKLVFGGAEIRSLSANVGLTVLRVFAGASLALGHGLKKMPPSQGFIDGVGDLGFPAAVLFAWLAALAELLGGMLVAIGLATRPAALFVLVTMCVAAFIRHAPDPFARKELALLYGVIALLFVLTGSGRLGVDSALRN